MLQAHKSWILHSNVHPWSFRWMCQKPQAPTPQAPIRHRQTRKVANAKGLNRDTNLT